MTSPNKPSFHDENQQFQEITSMEEYTATDFVDAIKRRDAEIDALRKELNEQCRINGMGGERELRLLTEIEELIKALKIISYDALCSPYIKNIAANALTRHQQRKS